MPRMGTTDTADETKLSLVILDGKMIVESAVLAWSPGVIQKIIPKRQPDRAKGREAAWIIALGKRRAFGNHVVQLWKKMNASGDKNEEEVYSFFALVGIGRRWVENSDVRWCLYRGERKLVAGKMM